jgi:hypothetical protein
VYTKSGESRRYGVCIGLWCYGDGWVGESNQQVQASPRQRSHLLGCSLLLGGSLLLGSGLLLRGSGLLATGGGTSASASASGGGTSQGGRLGRVASSEGLLSRGGEPANNGLPKPSKGRPTTTHAHTRTHTHTSTHTRTHAHTGVTACTRTHRARQTAPLLQRAVLCVLPLAQSCILGVARFLDMSSFTTGAAKPLITNQKTKQELRGRGGGWGPEGVWGWGTRCAPHHKGTNPPTLKPPGRVQGVG